MHEHVPAASSFVFLAYYVAVTIMWPLVECTWNAMEHYNYFVGLLHSLFIKLAEMFFLVL